MINNIVIGAKIRELRIKAKLSQVELGEALGRSHAAISDIERGKTNLTISDLSGIADLLKVPITDFFDIEVSSFEPIFTTLEYQGAISKEVQFGDLKLNIITNQPQKPQMGIFDIVIKPVSLSQNSSPLLLAA